MARVSSHRRRPRATRSVILNCEETGALLDRSGDGQPACFFFCALLLSSFLKTDMNYASIMNMGVTGIWGQGKREPTRQPRDKNTRDSSFALAPVSTGMNDVPTDVACRDCGEFGADYHRNELRLTSFSCCEQLVLLVGSGLDTRESVTSNGTILFGRERTREIMECYENQSCIEEQDCCVNLSQDGFYTLNECGREMYVTMVSSLDAIDKKTLTMVPLIVDPKHIDSMGSLPPLYKLIVSLGAKRFDTTELRRRYEYLFPGEDWCIDARFHTRLNFITVEANGLHIPNIPFYTKIYNALPPEDRSKLDTMEETMKEMHVESNRQQVEQEMVKLKFHKYISTIVDWHTTIQDPTKQLLLIRNEVKNALDAVETSHTTERDLSFQKCRELNGTVTSLLSTRRSMIAALKQQMMSQSSSPSPLCKLSMLSQMSSDVSSSVEQSSAMLP